jgi:hypothetical protein
MARPKFGEAQVELFKGSVPYELSYYIDVVSIEEARLLSEALYGRFALRIQPNTYNTMGISFVVVASHRTTPDAYTLPRSIQAILNAIRTTGVRATYRGFDRQEVPPPPQYFKDDDFDADDDGGFIGFRL